MSERANKPARSRRSPGSSVWTFSILLAVASLFGCGERSDKHPKDVVQWIKDCKGSIGYYDAELGSSELMNFEKVTIRDRSINDVSPLANMTKLKELDISDTQVGDLLPLANLRNLESLSLNGTQANDLLPLANLTNLRMLGLNDTQVSDVLPLANLRNLESLGLGTTQVNDVSPLANLTRLTSLNLRGTHVSDSSVDILRKALPNCDIRLD